MPSATCCARERAAPTLRANSAISATIEIMGTGSAEKACHDGHLGFKIPITIWLPLYTMGPLRLAASRADESGPPFHQNCGVCALIDTAAGSPNLPMRPCRSGELGRSNHRCHDDESTPATDIASTIAPQGSGSRSTSKACINPARSCRPCRRPPYAAPPRTQCRGPFPLPRPPGPMPRCFRR